MFAISHRNFTAFQEMLEAGADPNTPGFIGDYRCTPLDVLNDQITTSFTDADRKVLEGFELLLTSVGGRCYRELNRST